MNDSDHAASIHASNCIPCSSDLVHIVKIVINAYGTSWKSRRRSWIRKVEEVRLYKSKTSGWIYMPLIARRKDCNMIRLRYSSLRYRVQWGLRNREALKLLDANKFTYKWYNWLSLMTICFLRAIFWASNDCYLFEMSVNRASTIGGLTLCTIKWLHGHNYPKRKYLLA